MKIGAVLLVSQFPAVFSAASAQSKCGHIKDIFRAESCCGRPESHTDYQIVPMPSKINNKIKSDSNPCAGKKPGWPNINCTKDAVVGGLVVALEQAGADITEGYVGKMDKTVEPIMDPYWKKAMCPVNVHWHVGAEHKSSGEFDETFANYGPDSTNSSERGGFRCGHYNANDAKFTTPYNWKYCTKMDVGETYEVHWPHSCLGACGTTDQYQNPFYDGVFCNYDAVQHENLTLQQIAHCIGVQGQVFTIVNDESYYYPELIRGMIVEGDMGKNITKYTGSTTGTSRDNTICSAYAPITWQVDRTCHLISASSFDKMCADMLSQHDDMSGDTHPHGSRELVHDNFTVDSRYHRRLGGSGFEIHSMVF